MKTNGRPTPVKMAMGAANDEDAQAKSPPPECRQLSRHPHRISSSRLAIQHIQPGKPQQNAYIERYNRTVRHEWLGQYLFRTIEEVKDTATEWLWTYNHERPNMALGGITPAQKLRRQMEVQPSG
jgi:transposase InsO family protein